MIDVPSRLRLIRKAAALARIDETRDLSIEEKATESCSLDEGAAYFRFRCEEINRELKIRGIYQCRCDERQKTKTKEFKLLVYTGLVLKLEHLKIETRLTDEKFVNTMGENVTER